MRVAYLITRADPIGGAQVHVRDLALAVRERGHEPSVLTSGRGPFVDDLRKAGVPVTLMRHLAAPIRPVRDALALRELRLALRETAPDLIAAHSSKAGFLGRLAGRSLRAPVVFTVHGWSFTPGIPPLQAAVYRRVERVAAPWAARIITVSEYDRQLALGLGVASPDRLRTVHNGIPDVSRAMRADPGGAPVRMVMVARFEPQKDHATLLRALGGLRSLAWELVLVGDGPLAGDMRSLAAAEGLADRVHFLGRRTDVPDILARAHLSVLSTNWEGFPLSILEAMRAGLPVVSSAVGGAGESIAEGETGYLVARGDAAGLRDRLGRLVADAELRRRLGAAARARFEHEFSLDRMVAKTLAVYEEAGELTGRSARPIAGRAVQHRSSGRPQSNSSPSH